MSWSREPSWPSRPRGELLIPRAGPHLLTRLILRYDDMAASMKSVTETGIELSNEERNLLSVAYKVSPAGFDFPLAELRISPECCRGEEEFLEGDFKYRAEDGGIRKETADGQGIQRKGGEGAERYLSRCPGRWSPQFTPRQIIKTFFQGLLDKFLIAKASNAESKVFYLKMKGDYFRYLAEVAVGDAKAGK